jgi:amidophosphoribosyltransferase
MPSRTELIAAFRNDAEIQREIGADALIYQDLEAMKNAVRSINPALTQFDTSCFDGHYITGDVSADYLSSVEAARSRPHREENDGGQLDLNLISGA